MCLHVCVCACSQELGKQMKRETDKQNCMSWLVSCSFIRMQISCIQKHLGVFHSPISSLHSLPPLSSPLLIHQIHLSPWSFQVWSPASLQSFLLFFVFHFLPSSPPQLPFLSRLHLSSCPMPLTCTPSLFFFCPSFPVLLFISACLSPSVWVVFYSLISIYSKDNEEICEVFQCGSVVRGRI